MNFTLTDEQWIEFTEWKNEHDKKCKFSRQNNKNSVSSPTGAIGGRFTYSFTPTGLGVCTEVQCACGEKLNVTDVDNW